MTTNIKGLAVWFFSIKGILWYKAMGLAGSKLQNDSVHSENRSIFTATREEFFTADRTCNNVANKRVSFRQICGEVHFLPLISFLDS